MNLHVPHLYPIVEVYLLEIDLFNIQLVMLKVYRTVKKKE
jgi:hypothetical protein